MMRASEASGTDLFNPVLHVCNCLGGCCGEVFKRPGTSNPSQSINKEKIAVHQVEQIQIFPPKLSLFVLPAA
eukprot:1221481-Amphidinium_carterae.1